jgi:hypothetical protein
MLESMRNKGWYACEVAGKILCRRVALRFEAQTNESKGLPSRPGRCVRARSVWGRLFPRKSGIEEQAKSS